jgi:hypothetical protein
VKHRYEEREGCIDGLTELCLGKNFNPDGKTQYRVDIGSSERQLVPEDHLKTLSQAADRFVTSTVPDVKVKNRQDSKAIRL